MPRGAESSVWRGGCEREDCGGVGWGNMNAEGHKKKADELGDSFDKLLPDPEGEHVVAIGELTHGAAIHLIVFGMENKYNKHPDMLMLGMNASARVTDILMTKNLFVDVERDCKSVWNGMCFQ